MLKGVRVVVVGIFVSFPVTLNNSPLTAFVESFLDTLYQIKDNPFHL